MNYILAKQLKEAGLTFAVGRIGAFFWRNKDGELELQDNTGILVDPNREDIVVVPTLSELIEEVKIPKFTLIFDANGEDWYASIFQEIEATGKTPEEAVARLWLSLQHDREEKKPN
jgi:hypothetical protein